MGRVIILPRVIIDLDNRVVVQWDDKVPNKLWLYIRDLDPHWFIDENAHELWRFFMNGKEPETIAERWKSED